MARKIFSYGALSVTATGFASWFFIFTNLAYAQVPARQVVNREFQLVYVGSNEGWAPIPIEVYKGEIFFKAIINGVAASILLDNGVDASIVDAGFARKAGLRADGVAPSMYTGTAFVPGSYLEDVRMDVPKHLSVTGSFVMRDLGALAQLMDHPIDAVLGGDIVNQLAIGLIFSNRTLYLLPSGTIAPKASSAVIPLLNGSEVEAEINGVKLRLYVDLGSNGAIELSHRAWDRTIPRDARTAHDAFANGEGVAQTRSRADGNELRIGAITARGVPIGKAGSIPRGSDGLLGTAYLVNFDVVLDVQAKALTLIPRAGPSAR